MKKLALLLTIFTICSCASAPQPVVINKFPENKMRDDMSMEEYLEESTRYAVELKAYTDELINQIIHKAPYIDLRENK